MDAQKLPTDFAFLPEMYEVEYFPAKQVDKVKAAIQKVVDYLEKGKFTTEQVQEKLDAMTSKINDLQEDFEEHDSEIETGARESIADTVERMLAHFKVDIDIEEAIRERDW